jgi:hypothetical protein
MIVLHGSRLFSRGAAEDAEGTESVDARSELHGHGTALLICVRTCLIHGVIAGLDPAIQPVCEIRCIYAAFLDRRVKPSDDS